MNRASERRKMESQHLMEADWNIAEITRCISVAERAVALQSKAGVDTSAGTQLVETLRQTKLVLETVRAGIEDELKRHNEPV